LLLLLAACSDGASPPAAPTSDTGTPATAEASPSPSATPAQAAAPAEPDGDRILGYVKELADNIGPRPAGTAKEQESIDFISGLLRSFGYEVSVQDFSIAGEANREASVSLTSPAARSLTALPFSLSGASRARGRLVSSGVGRPAEFPASVSGNIALIERGELLFQDKVANAVAAGARGVIIFNNETGIFLGSLSQQASIPVVSISRDDGEALERDLGNGAIEAEVAVGALGTSVGHNVVAKPPGRECATVTGGHFDSVPQAPGASDNATGTATVIELASLMAASGRMGSNCFVLWGAEELGLIGSRAYVASLTDAQRESLKAVLNFDMVGVGDENWLLIGNPNLQQQATAVADQLGIETERGQLSGTSSDHASFISAGIPAVMFHRQNDPLLHTPQDVSNRVKPELLEEAARMGLGLLTEISRTGG
jgi:aminopeptidase YwaD